MAAVSRGRTSRALLLPGAPEGLKLAQILGLRRKKSRSVEGVQPGRPQAGSSLGSSAYAWLVCSAYLGSSCSVSLKCWMAGSAGSGGLLMQGLRHRPGGRQLAKQKKRHHWLGLDSARCAQQHGQAEHRFVLTAFCHLNGSDDGWSVEAHAGCSCWHGCHIATATVPLPWAAQPPLSQLLLAGSPALLDQSPNRSPGKPGTCCMRTLDGSDAGGRASRAG